MVRGIRMNVDFEHEFEMALMNRKLAPDIDVVCLNTDIQYQFVRASLLKEVARLGGDISGLAANDDYIYVGDGSVPVIRVYDYAGQHVFDIGREGQGPQDRRDPLKERTPAPVHARGAPTRASLGVVYVEAQ